MHKLHCNDCQGWFSREDVLKRHQRNVHGKEKPPLPAVATPSTPMQPPPPESLPPQTMPPPRESIPPPPPPSQQRRVGFVFKHPFTATISGPTSCGKTHFCKVLLQHCLTMIWSPPMWLYKRWQPLYDVINSTVYPSVEFIQGIPLDLDQDSFIHPRTKNLVILDDLVSMASKDSRITELFTEGSHHRNLSVIAIN